MKLSPKTRRNIARIIPFGVIWLLTGWVFILVEGAAMGTMAPDSPTIIALNIRVFVFASIAVAIVGLLVGFVEMVFLENIFRNKSFLQKITYKFGLYTLLMLAIIAIAYPIAASFESNISILDSRVWEKFSRFLVSVTFLSTLLQMASSLLLCVIYAVISENLGHAVLVNFFTGKYHTPREEKRIFMFLDMNASTTIAEQLGHIRYFELLREYYTDLSDGIINHSGEVYQYIGDEVVISWEHNAGLEDNNCVQCFFAMKNDLQKRTDFYKNTFDVVPTFKAGLHLGDVTTGEIGALKKEIFFTGDVLNTTSRIQGMCNHYEVDLLVSGELMDQLQLNEGINAISRGPSILKGRSKPIELFALEEATIDVKNNQNIKEVL